MTFYKFVLSNAYLALPNTQRIFYFLSIGLLTACGGGGGSSGSDGGNNPVTPPTTTTYSVETTMVKGLVTGANCELFELSAAGVQLNPAIASGTTANGLADFGNAIEYQGSAIVECLGGSYTDEATGASLTAPLLRAVVDIDGDSSVIVSPLTEIATQVAEAAGDLATALSTHNTAVASAFGLDGDITTLVPTDLNNLSASADDEGEYGTVLALISQLNANDSGSLSQLIDTIGNDLTSGQLSASLLTDLATAVNDLTSSEVASNLSLTAIANIVASAGIPRDDDNEEVADKPNILFILSDDQGVDSSAEYDYSIDTPVTPTLSGLASQGLVFENAWATPVCASTRAALLTGKHGVNNGVLGVPGNLDEEDETIFEFLAADENTSSYASAYVGKWHLNTEEIGGESNPVANGVSYYAGSLQGNVDDYFSWTLTEDSSDTGISSETSTEYNTSQLTRLAEAWIAEQDSPWFLTLAYNAPHTPVHLPDSALHTRDDLTNCNGNSSRDCYLAMIEAMDTEIGNLLDTLSDAERENTIVMFMGDNGTGNGQRDASVFGAGEVKGSLFEGGLRVPFVVSGAGVTRADEREDRLVTVTDMYATIAELAGAETNSIYDSISFANFLTSSSGDDRLHSYSDLDENWSIRNDSHQLINNNDVETLYQLSPSDFVLNPVTDLDTLFELQIEAARIRGELASMSLAASGEALDITDGGENGIYRTKALSCARFVRNYTATSNDLSGTQNNTQDDRVFTANLSISLDNGDCVFETDGIPNHDIQDIASFATTPSEQDDTYRVTATPEFADTIYYSGLGEDQGIYLNGVKIDIFAAACVGTDTGTAQGSSIERVGCNANVRAEEDEWRFDPMFADNGFNTDSHNAHTQPSGAYHYHGSPNALFDGTGSAESGVVGFAADGFPIYGMYINDQGGIRKVTASYQLKSGNRPVIDLAGSSAQYSQQPYNGAFRQDYEYVADSGDLDECNGMMRDGGYGYYVTEGFPYILICYRGTPDPSFVGGGGGGGGGG